MLKLPTTSDYAQEFTCLLGKTSYTFNLYFNTLNDGWFLDISSPADRLTVNGIPVVLGVDLMRPHVGFRGRLFCVSYGDTVDPKEGAFPDNCGIYWSATL